MLHHLTPEPAARVTPQPLWWPTPRLPVFRTLEDAEAFCRAEHDAGNTHARVSILASLMQTSDPSPCVVNAGFRPDKLAEATERLRRAEQNLADFRELRAALETEG